MNCTYCGYENSDSARYCNNCGQPLIEAVEPNTKVHHPRRRTISIAVTIAIAVVVFTVFFAVSQSSTDARLKGTWVRESTETAQAETIAYTFTSKGGTNTYNSEIPDQSPVAATFDWYITDDRQLILLWSNTSCSRYIWNPDFDSYTLSSNEYNWYVKGNKLYLSSSASPTGYYLYTR